MLALGKERTITIFITLSSVIPKLSEATIRHHASAQSFDRGQGYYRNGSVGSLIQRGNVLSARVEGSEADPYRISIHFDKGGITSATCTCPYDYERWCKHIVATLLACLHQPDQIEQRSELAELLAPLNREQLQMIVQNLANEQPAWMDVIEHQITQLTQSKTTKSQKASRRTTVDPKPIERQVQRIIDRYAEQWNDKLALDKIRDIVQKADQLIEQGDGNNALIILGAIARAYVQDWMNLDGSSGESGAFFEELDDALTEAILSAHLSASGRQQWQRTLETWRAEVDDYGIDSFNMSQTALEQGWESPPLQRVLQGEITELGAWEDGTPDFADDQALSIATQGFSLDGSNKYQLAVWTSELAEGMGQEVALQARLTAFQLRPSLPDYLKVQELAGDQWASLRQKLLTTLRQDTSSLDARAKAAIFLEEGLIDDAMRSVEQATANATVDQLSSYQSDVIHPVMDAAVAHCPEWVIENARRRAESIMNEGKAQYYYHAVNWLRKVRAAYLQLGQLEEWKRYQTALIQTHARKRKLVSLLQQRDLN